MSRSESQQPHISFDDEYRVRVLDKESIAHTQELEVESNQFATSASCSCIRSLAWCCACGDDRIDRSPSRLVVELEEFHETIKGVLEVLEGQAKRIEREKLKVPPTRRLVLSGDGLTLRAPLMQAIGQRNKVDNEVDNRNRQKQTLELQIKEKQTELERCVQVGGQARAHRH